MEVQDLLYDLDSADSLIVGLFCGFRTSGGGRALCSISYSYGESGERGRGEGVEKVRREIERVNEKSGMRQYMSWRDEIQ